MHIAIEGCCHGELRKIYSSLQRIEKQDDIKIDLLLICGDFQSIRNSHDLTQISVPDKFKAFGDFIKYYTGEERAPFPTIFIGGNHEASNYLWELHHGGWVCPNIYYLGTCGVVNFAGLRIAGLSGIFKSHNYHQGFFESHPLRGGDIKSIYHVRQFSVFQMAQIQEHLDVFMSHDWPLGIARHGNLDELMRYKSFLRKEIEDNTLGSPPAEMLLKKLKPDYWFSAHLHVKYAAVYNHQPIIPPKPVENPDEINLDSSDDDEDENQEDSANNISSTGLGPPKITKFLALDKCLPKRQFLQVIQVPGSEDRHIKLDAEWLSIVKATAKYMPFTREGNTPLLPSETEMKKAIKKAREWIDDQGEGLLAPPLFCKTAKGLAGTPAAFSSLAGQALVYCNPQTALFCQKLEIENLINGNGVKVDYITDDEGIAATGGGGEEEALAQAKKRLLDKLGM